MSGFLPLLALIAVGLACGFIRTGLQTWTVASSAALASSVRATPLTGRKSPACRSPISTPTTI